ncbi:hypothetical protein C8R46DRAFT_1229907 [Mycena filopes]|nr:hypothetical protein C8R46DRAFT_1229907 [Mycena filopes]
MNNNTSGMQAGLPYELLAEIMVLARTLGPFTKPQLRRFGTSTVHDVLALCQVCSYWRQVAFSTPQLWAGRPLPIILWRPPGPGRVATLPTEMFLEHSSPLPISISIAPLFMSTTTNLSPMIAGASHRWKTFKVACDGREDPFDTASLAQISGSLSALEVLMLMWSAPESWDGSELRAFLNAPRLRDVTINIPLVTSNNLSMPWAQLVCLSLTYDSPQMCLDALASCSSLTSAYINTQQWLDSDSPGNSYVGSSLLAHLTELKIIIRIRSNGEHFGPFLRRFNLPGLETLGLQLWERLNGNPVISQLIPTLTSFLDTCPDLKCLRLSNCVTSGDMGAVLRRTRNLKELDFNNMNVDDDFFAALKRSAPIPLVPNLESLTLMDDR